MDLLNAKSLVFNRTKKLNSIMTECVKNVELVFKV